MEIIRKFSGETEAEIWQQITSDLQQQGDLLDYSAEVNQQGRIIYLDIDIDLGGGFESGYETTRFLVPLPTHPTLRFHIHPEDWISEIGKFLGMEDVELGFPRMDKAYIVKTNQPEILKALFSDEEIRATIRKYADCDLRIITSTENNVESTSLSLLYEDAITDPVALREIYHAMYLLAEGIEKPTVTIP